MKDYKYIFKSWRSEKARISVRLNKKIIIGLYILTLLMIIIGGWLLVDRIYIGWILVGFSVIPAMMIEWHGSELKDLKIELNPKTIDDVLAADILGYLSNKPTPREIAAVVAGAKGGQFFTVRFGVGAGLLRDLSSDDEADTKLLWQAAWEICELVGSKKITAVILTVALIKIYPNYQSILNHLQLEYADLINGVKWYNHLIELIENHKMPKQTGGIARDWSFGWTPLLNRFGQNISKQSDYGIMLRELTAHNRSIDQLIDIFTKNGRQNAVLVGPTGVGKTEIIHAFSARLMDASQKLSSKLKFRQVFILDSSSLIAAASGKGELEQLVPRVLSEAYSAKNVIICLDNAQLFFNDGIGSIDISNVLLPILEAGNLRIILTMDEQEYIKIVSKNSQIANALNRISVPAASKEETIAVMQDKSMLLEFQNQVTFMYQSLVEAYKLGDRYVYDLAMPGKALKILESSAHYSENGLITARSVQQSIEKTLDIKISVATEDDERAKLLNLENLIHERMINQKRAVKVVSDALRRARAGVRNQSRPIGTFLFLGPTGVGKTELAKALADVYFGGEDRIIRLDMNEFVKSSDASRLIEAGSKNANSLTARVMKQPFSVILLDEIEKAHPNVLSVFLQMMDEGILRDIKNREVSFRDSIIIATSNAGADIIREYIERGYDISRFESQFVDGLINSNQFRPEFLNRFDEIVIFKPLEKDELIQVVDLMINSVNKTLSAQKVSVSVENEAKKFLVESGYDPRLGARPMRRIVQRAVENTVANQMLSGSINPGDVINITFDQVRAIIDDSNAANEIAKSSR